MIGLTLARYSDLLENFDFKKSEAELKRKLYVLESRLGSYFERNKPLKYFVGEAHANELMSEIKAIIGKKDPRYQQIRDLFLYFDRHRPETVA